MKKASGSPKGQMLPSLLPASFFKVLPLPLPQKFNRYHISALFFMKKASTLGSPKPKMLPSLHPPSSKCFRFHKNLTPSTFPLPHPWLQLRM